MGAIASSIALASHATSALTNVGTAYLQSRAIKREGEYQQQIAEINAKQLDIKAQDALHRGDSEVSYLRRRARRLVGSQRAALAAQGIDIDSGSAEDIQKETTRLGALDEVTAKNNAWKEAWGYRSEASNLRYSGRMARQTARIKARQTLVTGYLNGATDLGKAGYTFGRR